MRRIGRWLARVLEAATGGRVTLAGVGGTLGHSLVLEDLRLGAGGRTVVHVPRLEIVYAPLALVHGVVRLKRVTLTAPRVRAVVEGDARPLALPPRGGLPVVVDHLEVVDGRVAVALLDRESPRRFAATALTLAARGRLEGGGAELEVATIRFVPRGLALAPVAAAGRVTARPGGPARLSAFHLASGRSRLDAEAELDGTGAIDAHLALAPLAAADVRALAPRSALATDLRARVRMRGPWHALAVRAHADLGRGGASGRIRLDGRGFDATDRHARARLVLTHAVLRGVSLEHGTAVAVVDGARIRLASARVTGPELHARATAIVEHPLYGALGADRARARLALDGLGSRAPHGTLHLEAPALRVARA